MDIRQNYTNALSQILSCHGISLTLEPDDFYFLDEIVAEKSGRFSVAVTNMTWPRITDGQYFHFTTLRAANSIMTERVLRMYWVKKRVLEDEIGAFLTDFGYSYPLEDDPATGKPRYMTSLAEQRYYLSVTETGLSDDEEKYFWNEFAGPDGARIRFRIQSEKGSIRPLTYGDQLRPLAVLLKKIEALTLKLLNKKFHWENSSMVCALHLPEHYRIEKEVRVIVSKALHLPETVDGDHKFVRLHFGNNSPLGVRIDPIEVQAHSTIPVGPGVTMTLRH